MILTDPAPSQEGTFQPERPDAFISYSRRDTKFVERHLVAELRKRGKEVWIDLEDIPPAADWRDRVWGGIDSAKAFVFVLSPDSLVSDICRAELERAVEQNKRIVPVVRRDVDPKSVPETLERPNWIWFRDGDDPDAQFARLVAALETDLEWRDMHARLSARANEWRRAGDDKSFLLRGSDLAAAERWLSEQARHSERATPLQIEFIVQSRRAGTRRQRITLAVVTVGLAVSVALTIFALLQRSAAIEREKTARSRELAAIAKAQLVADPELSALIAREAVSVSPTLQAENALRIALAQTHVHQVLRPPGGAVWAADFSPSGQYLATASSDRRIRVWDIRSAKEVAVLAAHGPGSSADPRYPVTAAFGGGGDLLTTAGDDGTVRIWDWRAERMVFERAGLGEFVTTAQLSSDGNLLLIGRGGPGGTAELWTWRLSRKVVEFGKPVGAEAGAFGVDDAAFSDDDALVATASSVGGVVRVWEQTTGRLLRGFRITTEFVESIDFHPNGRLIVATSSDGTASIWNWSRGKQVAELRADGALNDAEFDPDGDLVITASEDGTGIVWDWAAEQDVAVLRGHRGAIHSAHFSPDSEQALTAGEDGTVRIWTRLVQRPASMLRSSNIAAPGFMSVSFSPDGNSILTADGTRTARVWDWRGERVTHELHEPEGTLFEESGGPWMISSFSDDGHLILTASDPGFRVWDLKTEKSLAFLPVPNPGLASSAFAPEAAVVVAAGWDRVVRVWDWRKNDVVAELRTDEPIGHALFSPDGDYVATTTVSPEPSTSVWDWRTRQVLATIESGTAASFSPDGRLLAVVGVTTQVWDWRNGRIAADLRGPGWSYDAEFSKDGRLVLTSSGDVSSGEGGVQVWD